MTSQELQKKLYVFFKPFLHSKTISDMKENHERVLKKVEKTFNKYLDIY